MEFKRVIVSPHCLSVIAAESRKARHVETGGPLVGWVSGQGVLVVEDASGPGPRSRLERCSVTIDGEFAQKFCDQILRKSNGEMDYIGDWHKHTGISLSPSEQDIEAMRLMANFEFSPTDHPISLIYRSWPKGMSIYVWNAGTLKKIRSTIGVLDRH